MILLFVLLVCLVAYYYWERRNLIYLASKIKGPNGYPFIGSAYKFLNSHRIFDVIREFGETYGGPGKFWLANRLFVYINDPSHCETILINADSMDKGDSYDFVAEMIGYGLITLKSENWRFHRKHLNPCFTPNIINTFYPIFNKGMAVLVEKLKRHVGKGPFNIAADIRSCAMDLICETTLGLKINTQSANNLEFLDAAHEVLEITGKRFFQPWIQPKMLFRMSKHYAKFHRGVTALSMLVSEIFTTKKGEYFSKPSITKAKSDDGANQKSIFIDQILKLSLEDEVFNDMDVTSELKTILLAGYETTATAAMNTFALLAIYPECQEKVFQEIRSVLPGQNDDVTKEDINNMPYLDAFVKEAFRFLPVVPILTRIIKKDIQIDNVTIPKGTEVIMDIWGMHRNKNYWKFDASKFNPENFFPENAVPRSAYAYIPFSAGPRNCIGKKYGIGVMKLLIIYIVRQYRLSTKLKLEDLKFQMQVTLGMLNQNVIEIENRDVY